MHAEEIVNRMLKNGLGSLHEKQAAAVRAGVVAALERLLSLSRLARRVSGEMALRHRVRRMDRLPGNEAIHARRAEIYRGLPNGIRLLSRFPQDLQDDHMRTVATRMKNRN